MPQHMRCYGLINERLVSPLQSMIYWEINHPVNRIEIFADYTCKKFAATAFWCNRPGWAYGWALGPPILSVTPVLNERSGSKGR